MKKTNLFFLVLFFSCYFGLSQRKVTSDEIKSLTKKWSEFVAPEYDEYVAIDQHSYKVGDTIIFGRPSSEKIFSFIQENSDIIFSKPENNKWK